MVALGSEWIYVFEDFSLSGLYDPAKNL